MYPIDLHVCTIRWLWLQDLLTFSIASGELPTGVCALIEGNDL